MTDYETLAVTRADQVATVTLNRPAVHNAFDATLIADLTDAFTRLGRDASIRAIVLQGHGPSFCAGADVNWMRASLDYSFEENTADALRMADMFHTIDSARQAVIGRVHGAALGGGMGLLAVCDIVIAAEGTQFGFTEARLGIIPAVISAFVVPKIGPSWARALFLTGERFDAARALKIGLIHDVVSPAELDARIRSRVDAVLQCGPLAVFEAKVLLSRLPTLPPSAWRQYTAELIASVRTSREGQEGLRAFLEKREPIWRRD